MRTKLGYALTFLGVFLIVVAILAQTYAKTSLKKTPSDADSLTNLSGTAILNGPEGFEQFPVLAFSTTKADSDKSDGDVVLFQYSSCVVRDEGGIEGCVSSDDPEGRLLTASTDTFAADRKTALAVNDDDYLPAGAMPHEGLLNKWPFDAQKKTYPYWDGTINQAVRRRSPASRASTATRSTSTRSRSRTPPSRSATVLPGSTATPKRSRSNRGPGRS